MKTTFLQESERTIIKWYRGRFESSKSLISNKHFVIYCNSYITSVLIVKRVNINHEALVVVSHKK